MVWVLPSFLWESKTSPYSNQLKLSWVCKLEWSLTNVKLKLGSKMSAQVLALNSTFKIVWKQNWKLLLAYIIIFRYFSAFLPPWKIISFSPFLRFDGPNNVPKHWKRTIFLLLHNLQEHSFWLWLNLVFPPLLLVWARLAGGKLPLHNDSLDKKHKIMHNFGLFPLFGTFFNSQCFPYDYSLTTN